MTTAGFLTRNKRTSGLKFNKNDLWTFGKYNVKADGVKHAAFLSNIVLYKNLHFTGQGKQQICEADYFDEQGNALICNACQQPSVNFPDQLNFPTEHLIALVCVFEDKDQMRVSKKGKEYPINWIQVLALPTNKKGVYVSNIEEAIENGFLMDDIWKFKKNKENELQSPSALTARELAKLGNQLDTEMHKELQRDFSKKTNSQVLSEMLSAFSGVKYDNHELIEMGIKPIENPEEAPAEASGLDSD